MASAQTSGDVRERETWVDQVKLFACVLVVLGHFFQSMTKAQLMPEGDAYLWFEQTIYTFHVPLFFICSGYLYQRYSRVDSAASWWLSVRKKLLALGVPYAVFTAATVGMKVLAGDLANSAGGGLLETLLLAPTAPYWYLYVLFFMFVLTPTVRTRCGLGVLLGLSLACKLAVMLVSADYPYIVGKLFDNEVWLAGGMALAKRGADALDCVPGGPLVALFAAASIALYACGLDAPWALFLLGALGCLATLAVFHCLMRGSAPCLLDVAARYTMPIYLMHTIFAAGVRVALLKLGVTALAVHLALGLAATFFGPVLAMVVLERLKPLDFVVYPGRYVKLGRLGNCEAMGGFSAMRRALSDASRADAHVYETEEAL